MMAGNVLVSYLSYFYTLYFPEKESYYALNESLAIFIGGFGAQLWGAFVCQYYWPGLSVPILQCTVGGVFAAAVFYMEDFDTSILFLWLMWATADGWTPGVLATLNQILPPGPVRNTAVGMFFSLSNFIGVADVQLVANLEGVFDFKRLMIVFVSGAYWLAALTWLGAMLIPVARCKQK